MNRSPVCLILLAAAVSLWPSCGLFRRSRPPASAPPVLTAPPKAERPPPTTKPLPEPPEIEPAPVSTLPPPPIPAAVPAAQPPPPKRTRTRSGSSKTGSEDTGLEELRTPAPVPQLTHLLSDEQRRRYASEIEQRLANIQRYLEQLANRALNEEGMLMLDRVRAFMRQAQEARASDLVTALSLARRAEVLAADLARSTR